MSLNDDFNHTTYILGRGNTPQPPKTSQNTFVIAQIRIFKRRNTKKALKTYTYELILIKNVNLYINQNTMMKQRISLTRTCPILLVITWYQLMNVYGNKTTHRHCFETIHRLILRQFADISEDISPNLFFKVIVQ